MKLVAALLLANGLLPAAELTGIWTGQTKGRNDEVEDIAIKFRQAGDSVTGTMFGDEFDLPIADASLKGDQLTFSVTRTDYSSKRQNTVVRTGVLKGNEIELTRERVPSPDDKPPTAVVPTGH